jgi:DNA-binding NarL/FixJ family response regulator
MPPSTPLRIVLIGADRARTRLRRALSDAGVDVAGEADTLAAAKALDLDADAFVLSAHMRADGDIDTSADPLPIEPLTAREQEVLERLAEGLPNKAIAARLKISDQTVKFHVASIYGKLGAANRTEAVRLAIKRGLVAV